MLSVVPFSNRIVGDFCFTIYIPGRRNNTIYTLAIFFRLDGIPEDAAIDYLVAYYVDSTGGLLADEIKRTVKSAYLR